LGEGTETEGKRDNAGQGDSYFFQRLIEEWARQRFAKAHVSVTDRRRPRVVASSEFIDNDSDFERRE
jgi:hypothetical protein